MKPGSILFSTTGAVAIVEVLKFLKVQRVFGVPGVQNIELFDALADAPFQTLTPTNESAAIFMADAHARVTGDVGIAIVTAGPGLTNALTGIAEAQLDSSPLVVLVGSSVSLPGKSFQLHQIQQSAIVQPLVKGYFKPSSVEEIPHALLQAVSLARQGEPGATVIEISSTLLMSGLPFIGNSAFHADSAETSGIGTQLDQAAELLRNSQAIGIYAGAGAIEATEELRCLAELLQAPVATTISGRGIIPEDHPLSVGFGFGRAGTAAAWRVFRKVHTLLAVGCKYGETATGSYGVKPPREHIHIDINPRSLGANYPTSLPIVGDARTALTGLLARLKRDHRPADAILQNVVQQARAQAKAKAQTASGSGISPGQFLRRLRHSLDRDAILVTDSGAHQFWALNDFPVFAARSFLAPANFQAMGFSIPAGIAAKLAFPGRQVVSLVGDGGFLMSGFELLNAVRWGANILVVIFKDGAWGLIREAQRRIYRRTPFTRIANPDFQQLALSFGIKWVRMTSAVAMDSQIQEALSAKTPVLMEVIVDYSEAAPYVKGAGPQMFRNLLPRLQARAALRLAKRICFPPKTPES